jgi:hypothetical protein
MTDPVSREEFRMLSDRVGGNERRLDAIDAVGTRGVAVLAVQVQELSKDLAAHEVKHDVERARQAAGRKWIWMALIAIVAAVDGPVVSVLLTLRAGH